MKTYQLLKICPATKPTVYKVNGRRVSRERYNEVNDSAIRRDTYLTVRVRGVFHHYHNAYLT